MAATGAATGAATDGGGGESQFGIGIDDKTGQAMFDEQKKKQLHSNPWTGLIGWRQPQFQLQLPVPTG